MKTVDCNENEINIGDAVCLLTSGNFIYGHVTAINEVAVDVIPDIGYKTSKQNFRLKKVYHASSKNIALIDEDKTTL